MIGSIFWRCVAVGSALWFLSWIIQGGFWPTFWTMFIGMGVAAMWRDNG